MRDARPTVSQIRAQVALIHRRRPADKIIGIQSNTHWQGEDFVPVEGRVFRFAQCDSVLQMREVLINADLEQHPLVIITPLEESELGNDLLARLSKRKLFTVRAWDTLLELFQARTASPSLLNKKWLAETLLERVPPQGYPATPSGALDEDTVWGIVLCEWLHFPSARPDVHDLVAWTLREGVQLYQAMSAELRQGVRDWIEQTAGEAGAVVFRLMNAGHARDLLPFGLVCQVVFHDSEYQELREAAVRLERFTSNASIERGAGRALGDAASSLVEKLATSEEHETISSLLSRADQILNELGIGAFAYLSNYSRQGFAQLLDKLGQQINAALAQTNISADNAALETSQLLAAHYQARFHGERIARMKMALRLLQWLAQGDTPKATGLEHAAKLYSKESGFVDWARHLLSGGESVGTLARSYSLLLHLAGEKREAENKTFAELLSVWTALGSPGDRILRVEDLLDQVVAPLANRERVLLIIVDGMSVAVFQELFKDISSKGWIPLGPHGNELPPVISALPSITEVSRASLLCGVLTSGVSAVEVNGFKSHKRLVQASRSGCPPVLFHKGSLTTAGGFDLADAARREILSERRKVVGVVVNAVDDHLAKGSQIAAPWRLEHLPVLGHLLSTAHEAGRIVIMTSDHGHVLERDTSSRRGDLGERYRLTDGKPLKDELIVKGNRVVLSEGDGFIASWSEMVRYGTKKHGYHGGTSPQECVVPLAVLARTDRKLTDWEQTALQEPVWWDISPKHVPSNENIGIFSLMKAIVNTKAVNEPRPLFAEITETDKEGGENWIDSLTNSPTFNAQLKLMGKSAPSIDLTRSFLAACAERGVILKATLAKRLGQPKLRMNGIVAAMRRLLNVDGYSILSVDEASDTIMLNIDLLKIQFDVN